MQIVYSKLQCLLSRSSALMHSVMHISKYLALDSQPGLEMPLPCFCYLYAFTLFEMIADTSVYGPLWCLNMSLNSNNPIWFSVGESKHHRRGGGPGLYWSGHWPAWIRSTCCHLFNAARCEVYNPHPHPRYSCSEYAAERQEKADSLLSQSLLMQMHHWNIFLNRYL